MLFSLIYADFKNRYLGNHLGIIWAFIQPLVMVAVYFFVFTKGFRGGTLNKVPFLLWLLSGLVPWFLMNDAIVNASSSITSQSFLVKKIVFDVQLLPLIKIGSAILVNLFFWIFLLIICLIYGYYPNWLWFQLAYYLFCIIAISLSLSLLFSAIMPFLPDLHQFLLVIFQVLFWTTPIMWNENMLHGQSIYIIKFNPFAYIIDGFRETLIDHQPFWQHYYMMIFFWLFIIFSYYLGSHTFNRLRPHFADVL